MTASWRSRQVLVCVEIALSLILLVGAGLMIESFRRAYGEALGVRTDHVLALEVFLPRDRYPSELPQKRSGFVSAVLDRLSRLPGVNSVAATNYLPLSGFWGTTDFAVEGQPPAAHDQKPSADDRLITPGYFSTLGIGVIRGRDFNASDRLGSETVAIINATLAQRYFGGDNPIGKVVELRDPTHPDRWRIVGEVSDVRAFGPEQAAHPDLYRPLAQVTFPLIAFVARTAGYPSAMLNSAERTIWDVDKDQPIFNALPLERLAAQSITLRRTSTILLAAFAALALAVAAVGLYGLMAYSVAQRTHEIGIRMALGAERRDVLRLVVRNGMALAVGGGMIGFGLALILTRLVSGVLYRVSPSEPWMFATALAVLLLVSLAAICIPALRAAKVDPMVALRYE